MNKQIEEMTKDLTKICPDLGEDCYGQMNCVTHLTLSLSEMAEYLYKAGYRKSSDVIDEVLEILSELKEDFRYYDDMQKVSAIRYAETNIAAFKKKYESEGAE